MGPRNISSHGSSHLVNCVDAGDCVSTQMIPEDSREYYRKSPTMSLFHLYRKIVFNHVSKWLSLFNDY